MMKFNFSELCQEYGFPPIQIITVSQREYERLFHSSMALFIELKQRRQEVSEYGKLRDRIQELEEEAKADKADYEKLYDRYVSQTMENGRLRRQLEHQIR